MGRKLIRGINDLETWSKQNNCVVLLSEWDYDKNNNLKPSDIPYGSSQKINWKCNKGHEWQISPNRRIKDNKVYSCPYCSGRKAIIGENDLATTHPDLAKEWNYEKNEKLTPQNVKAGTNTKVWWKCSSEHEWPATIYSRAINGNGCPYCSGRFVLKGVNDLKTWCESNCRQDLLAEWDPTNKLLPDQVTYRCDKYAKWICKNGHQYSARIHNRTNGTGCPYCVGQKVSVGETDLETWCKNNGRTRILTEWDRSKNKLLPQAVTFKSGRIIWFKCSECGHEWKTTIVKRTKYNRDCPECSDKRSLVIIGENDLETWCKTNGRTHILDEWDYTKNSFTPTTISYSNDKKAWFKCHICGHEWQTEVFRRTLQHLDCGACSKRVRSSFPEQSIFYYISAAFPDAVNTDRRVLKGMELDIWIPSINTAIEYDGEKWHQDSKRDKNKCKICKDKGISLYRVREMGCSELDTTDAFIYKYESGDWTALSEIVSEMLRSFGVENIDVDISRDEFLIKEQYYKKSVENSFGQLYPELAKQWHPTKNGKITPNMVNIGTDTKYYWLCPNGHTYKSRCYARIHSKGCPDCYKQSILNKRIVGQTNIMKNGLTATVIADRGAVDIDVQFENGIVVTHKQRDAFKKGLISLPRTITGMSRVMKNGLTATVIADRGAMDIDVQFENGVVVEHKRRSSFKSGSIKIDLSE